MRTLSYFHEHIVFIKCKEENRTFRRMNNFAYEKENLFLLFSEICFSAKKTTCMFKSQFSNVFLNAVNALLGVDEIR